MDTCSLLPLLISHSPIVSPVLPLMPSDRGMFWNNVHSYNGMQYRYILVASVSLSSCLLGRQERCSLPPRDGFSRCSQYSWECVAWCSGLIMHFGIKQAYLSKVDGTYIPFGAYDTSLTAYVLATCRLGSATL